MKPFGWAICVLALFVAPHRMLGSPVTFEIAEGPDYVYDMDFSVDSEYAYIVYRSLPPDYDYRDYRELRNSEPLLGIYSLSTGTEVSRVDFGSVWEGFPVSRARTVAKGGGVVVQADGPGALLAHVDPGGVVTVRRHYEGVRVDSLDRYRDFTMVQTSKSVMLLDDQFKVEHEWNVPEPILLVAEPSGDEIVVLGGELLEDVNGRRRLSVTVRWLTLKGPLVEKASIALPETLSIDPPSSDGVWPPVLSSTTYHPEPFLLVWPGRLWVFVLEDLQWQKCVLGSGESEFACAPVPWQDTVYYRNVYYDVVRSGDDGYVVADKDGCAIWSRRYDFSDALSGRQLTFPSGSSSLGLVRDGLNGLRFRERDGGGLFVLISSSRTSGGDDPTRHTVLRSVEFSESTPAAPEIDWCWQSPYMSHSTSVRAVNHCIKGGADPNAFGSCGAWSRPLSMAARTSEADVIRALLEAGADPNAWDEDGDTALHDAARYGKAGEKLEALLEGGANPTLRNNAGKLPWDYARQNEALRGSSVLERLRPREGIHKSNPFVGPGDDGRVR